MTQNLPEGINKKVREVAHRKLEDSCPIRFEFDGEDELQQLKRVIVDNGYSFRDALEKVFGTRGLELVDEIINKSTNAMGSLPQEKKQNMLSQSLADCNPKNAMEAKLCAQAQVLFTQGLRLMGFANDSNMMCHQEHYMKYSIKCLRLHNETLQTLDKLRRGGEQKVIVQHVNVEGGQNAFMTCNVQAGEGERKR